MIRVKLYCLIKKSILNWQHWLQDQKKNYDFENSLKEVYLGGQEVDKVNRVGKYAASSAGDDLVLMNMVFELTEKDKMVMWSEGYIDQVIKKLPMYAQDILEVRKEKWEDTKAYYEKQLNEIVNQEEFKMKLKGERKEFALFVMERYPEFRSLLFLIYDGNLKDDDLRKFVYRRRFASRKKYLH